MWEKRKTKKCKDGWTGRQIDRYDRASVLVPVPSLVNEEGSVRRSIQHESYKISNRSKDSVWIDELM